MGLGAGPQFPTLVVFLAAWIPQKESGKLGALALSGAMVSKIKIISPTNDSSGSFRFVNFPVK